VWIAGVRQELVTVVAGNALWIAASAAVVLADLLTLPAAGAVLTLLQAEAVAVLSALQLLTVRP
jgi:hypothetical protein